MSEQTITYVGEPLARQFKDKIEANKKNIANEVERATSKEAALETAITGETERATEAEGILDERIVEEMSRATAVESNLQSEINTIHTAQNCVDIVATYADLLELDTSILHDNDKVEVLADETHEGNVYVYRLTKPEGGEAEWTGVGAMITLIDSWKQWSKDRGSSAVDEETSAFIGVGNTSTEVRSYQFGNGNTVSADSRGESQRQDTDIAVNVGTGNTIEGEGMNLGKGNSSTMFGITLGQRNTAKGAAVAIGTKASAEGGSIALNPNANAYNHASGASVSVGDYTNSDGGSISVAPSSSLPQVSVPALVGDDSGTIFGIVYSGVYPVTGSYDGEGNFVEAYGRGPVAKLRVEGNPVRYVDSADSLTENDYAWHITGRYDGGRIVPTRYVYDATRKTPDDIYSMETVTVDPSMIYTHMVSGDAIINTMAKGASIGIGTNTYSEGASFAASQSPSSIIVRKDTKKVSITTSDDVKHVFDGVLSFKAVAIQAGTYSAGLSIALGSPAHAESGAVAIGNAYAEQGSIAMNGGGAGHHCITAWRRTGR